MRAWLAGLVTSAWLAACGGPPARPVLEPAPAPATPTARDRVVDRQRVVEAFFGGTFAPYRLELAASHAEMERLGGGPLPCFAVGMGTGSLLLLLDPSDPARWRTEACAHEHDDEADVDRVIVHELVHVFHGQQRPDDRELERAEEVGWFVEGLATYASGQLDAEREQQLRAVLAAGQAPRRLADAWAGNARYAVCGSLVRFVDQRLGRAGLKRLLAASTNAELLAALGLTEAELLAAWQASLAP